MNRWPPALCAASFLITGCGHASAQTAAARFTESGVEVTIHVSSVTVAATYRPLRSGYHIYGIGLPEHGIDGLGVATRLKVRGGLTAAGPMTADKTPRTLDLPALGVRLPVYPNGPVTVSLPVRRSGNSADVLVSYGACSKSTCSAPVVDHPTRVTLH